jgi:hypothetical protein
MTEDIQSAYVDVRKRSVRKKTLALNLAWNTDGSSNA